VASSADISPAVDANNGWERWSAYVRAELQRQSKEVELLRGEIVELRLHLEALRVRVTVIFGVVGPMIGLIGAMIGYIARGAL